MARQYFINDHGGISVAEINYEEDAVWIDGDFADQYQTLDDFFDEYQVFDTMQEAVDSM